MSIYDFTVKTAAGNDINLSEYKGNPMPTEQVRPTVSTVLCFISRPMNAAPPKRCAEPVTSKNPSSKEMYSHKSV